MLDAAALLADAEVDLILWNGTAAGWLGFDWDAQLVAAIEAHTGIPATTAVIGLNEELRRLGARKIGLVTPYVASLEARIIANYCDIGIEVVSAVRRDLTVNTDYRRIAAHEIAAMVREAAQTSIDAIVILCTNLAGSSVADRLSAELGTPVLDSVRAAVRHSLASL